MIRSASEAGQGSGPGRAAAARAVAAATGPRGKPRTRGAGNATKLRIIDAALQTLCTEGYAGTTARAIGRAGDLNPALIFYHFGGVDPLLLAALDHSSALRMRRYRERLTGVDDIVGLITAMRELYAEDLGTPHVAAVQEMVASSAFNPEMGPQIAARMEEWLAFAEEVVERFLGGTVLEALLGPRDVAFAIVALYLGMETVARLRGEQEAGRITALFESGERLSPLLARLVGRPAAAEGGAQRPVARVPVE